MEWARATQTARESLSLCAHKPGSALGHRTRGNQSVYRNGLHLIQTGEPARPLRPHGLAQCPADSPGPRAQGANVRTEWPYMVPTNDDGPRKAVTRPMRDRRGYLASPKIGSSGRVHRGAIANRARTSLMSGTPKRTLGQAPFSATLGNVADTGWRPHIYEADTGWRPHLTRLTTLSGGLTPKPRCYHPSPANHIGVLPAWLKIVTPLF